MVSGVVVDRQARDYHDRARSHGDETSPLSASGPRRRTEIERLHKGQYLSTVIQDDAGAAGRVCPQRSGSSSTRSISARVLHKLRDAHLDEVLVGGYERGVLVAGDVDPGEA